jgi:PPM family protein phosphatase
LTGAPAVRPATVAVDPPGAPDGQPTGLYSTPVATPRRPRTPVAQPRAERRGRRLHVRRAGLLLGTLVVLALIGGGAFLALQSVYFIGTNDRGLVTLYQGVPFMLPGNIELYSSQYVSGVGASTLSSQRRSTLLDHTLRSEAKAASLIRSLELDQLE